MKNFVILLGPPSSGKGYISYMKLQVYGLNQMLPSPIDSEEMDTMEGDAELRRYQQLQATKDFNDLYAVMEQPKLFNQVLVKKYYQTRGGDKISLYKLIDHKSFQNLFKKEESNKDLKKKYISDLIADLEKDVETQHPMDKDAFQKYYKLCASYYVSMRGLGDEGAVGQEFYKYAAKKTFNSHVKSAIERAKSQGGGGSIMRDLVIIDTPGEDIRRTNEYSEYVTEAKKIGYGTTVVVLFPGVDEAVAQRASKMGNFSRGLSSGDRMVDPKTDIDPYFTYAPNALHKLSGLENLDVMIHCFNETITNDVVEGAIELIVKALLELGRKDLANKAQVEDNVVFSQLTCNLLQKNKSLPVVQELEAYVKSYPIFKPYKSVQVK